MKLFDNALLMGYRGIADREKVLEFGAIAPGRQIVALCPDRVCRVARVVEKNLRAGTVLIRWSMERFIDEWIRIDSVRLDWARTRVVPARAAARYDRKQRKRSISCSGTPEKKPRLLAYRKRS